MEEDAALDSAAPHVVNCGMVRMKLLLDGRG